MSELSDNIDTWVFRGGSAMEHYRALFRGTNEYDYPFGNDDALADLLADLMHWADKNNLDFEGAYRRGRNNYLNEADPCDESVREIDGDPCTVAHKICTERPEATREFFDAIKDDEVGLEIARDFAVLIKAFRNEEVGT